jgi:TRAP-type C4-dicarboxylate transport system substrate-binding protein
MITFNSAAALFLALATGASAATPIKFATLAPEGSTWMKELTELSKDLEKSTGGELKLKFYAGGVAGDEKDVVKKMRIGQLHAAGFTGVGLGEVAPETRLLDAPWLFRDRSELAAVREKLNKDFEAALDRAGFVLLGWTDLGSVYVFSRTKVDGPEDMRKAKMWVWEGDPIASSAYKALGVSPVPLSVVDVMQSLQTGMIDAVYGPPLGVVALGWHAKLKHIYPVPMAESTGAVLVTKKFFDALAPEQQKTLREVSARHLKRLNELTNAENDKALETLSKNGLELSAKPGPETLKRYEELGRAARKDLAGKLFPAELAAKLEKELAALRARKTPSR